jgi:hypothetical protein
VKQLFFVTAAVIGNDSFTVLLMNNGEAIACCSSFTCEFLASLAAVPDKYDIKTGSIGSMLSRKD